MSELSIKVIIAGRTYPLTVKREEEEQVRKAASRVNENIKSLQENYAVKDMQDLLSMTALQYAVENVSQQKVVETDKMELAFEQLNQRIVDYLNE